MAEAARRLDYAGGSDAVHRLIARPIRLEHSRQAPPPEPEPQASLDEDGDRLRAELDLLKAILRAERAEAAGLRARLSASRSEPGTGAEVAAMRDRWAGLFDRLLLDLR